MSTAAVLTRLLLRRVACIDLVDVQTVGPFRVRVGVRPKANVAFEQARDAALQVLGDEACMGVACDVVPHGEDASPHVSSLPDAPSLAAFESDQTLGGLKKTLVGAIPTLGRAVWEERPGQEVRVLVAHENGTCTDGLVARVRATLESAGVVEFLRLVPAQVFAKIVHRIATNPTEHRSGLPDYMVWKGRELCFVEVKGAREQIREGQQAWISWMQAQGIAVKVVRVKGVSPA
jgi:hypothetical protein